MSFDTHLAAALDRILQGLRTPLEDELRSYASGLDRQAAAAVDAARKAVFEEAEERVAAARDAARREVADLRAEFEEERQAAEERAQEALRSVHTLEAECRDLQARLSDALAAHQALRTAAGQAAADQEHLGDAVQSIAGAATVGDVLDRVVRHAGAMAARVAVLVERDGQLRDWALSGFALEGARGQRIAMSSGGDDLLGRAVRERQPAVGDVALAGDGMRAGLVTTDVPATAVAWPLVIGGRSVAVLYAETPSRDDDAAWVARLGVLAGHAAAVLELRTLQASVGIGAGARSGHAAAR